MQPPPSDAEFGALDQRMQQLQSQQLMLGVPPPVEPIEPGLVQLLTQTVQSTMDRVGEGEIPIQLGQGQATSGGVPDDLGAAIVGLSKAVETLEPTNPEVQRYRFDPAQLLRSNDGLKDLIGIVGAMGADDYVVRCLQGRKQEQLPVA